jgi:hypothetical protein
MLVKLKVEAQYSLKDMLSKMRHELGRLPCEGVGEHIYGMKIKHREEARKACGGTFIRHKWTTPVIG